MLAPWFRILIWRGEGTLVHLQPSVLSHILDYTGTGQSLNPPKNPDHIWHPPFSRFWHWIHIGGPGSYMSSWINLVAAGLTLQLICSTSSYGSNSIPSTKFLCSNRPLSRIVDDEGSKLEFGSELPSVPSPNASFGDGTEGSSDPSSSFEHLSPKEHLRSEQMLKMVKSLQMNFFLPTKA